MISVFLVDDHEVVRRRVTDPIESDPGLRVVGEAATAAQALARIPALCPDVVVLDVRLPDGNGIELCRELRSRLPGLHVLMLTAATDEEAMLNTILAGAGGYVIKDVQGIRLDRAIHQVRSGGSLCDTRAAAMLVAVLRANASLGPLARLTDRERALFDLIAEGLTNTQIAERMRLAEVTVRKHVSGLLAMLGREHGSPTRPPGHGPWTPAVRPAVR